MPNPKTTPYAQCFERVLAYIEQHLEQPLSVEQLSRVAHFSKYHFHRQFSQYLGIGVSAYIRQRRMKRASYQLAFGQERVIDIAQQAGFDSPEAFSRAFRQAFRLSPSQFRKTPEWPPWHTREWLPPHPRSTSMHVNLIDFSETPVAQLLHRGAPERVNDSARRFIAWRKASGLSPVGSRRTFGIAYHDPDTTPAAQFRFAICGEEAAPIPPNPQGVENGVIPGGRCAVIRHMGSHDRLSESIYPLYREWLPQSGETLRDFPLFFHYLNLFPEVAEHQLITDIYLPLAHSSVSPDFS